MQSVGTLLLLGFRRSPVSCGMLSPCLCSEIHTMAVTTAPALAFHLMVLSLFDSVSDTPLMPRHKVVNFSRSLNGSKSPCLSIYVHFYQQYFCINTSANTLFRIIAFQSKYDLSTPSVHQRAKRGLCWLVWLDRDSERVNHHRRHLLSLLSVSQWLDKANKLLSHYARWPD